MGRDRGSSLRPPDLQTCLDPSRLQTSASLKQQLWPSRFRLPAVLPSGPVHPAFRPLASGLAQKKALPALDASSQVTSYFRRFWIFSPVFKLTLLRTQLQPSFTVFCPRTHTRRQAKRPRSPFHPPPKKRESKGSGLSNPGIRYRRTRPAWRPRQFKPLFPVTTSILLFFVLDLAPNNCHPTCPSRVQFRCSATSSLTPVCQVTLTLIPRPASLPSLSPDGKNTHQGGQSHWGDVSSVSSLPGRKPALVPTRTLQNLDGRPTGGPPAPKSFQKHRGTRGSSNTAA